jgi:hypothetical protein
VARRQGGRLFELRATVSLCRLLRDLGRREAAWRILVRVWERFDAHLDSPDLQAAWALLAELAPGELSGAFHEGHHD